ncbi:SusC/RagA family TonB-linked outer membrane protein [Bacteroidia bacterium]|nr:SusC/RagA family TonB-linked outer membrane protein [Bacteroidia bacterium]GHT80204.1 SusC/RagA family TonB-linked outer membrane protein [Bacteroidia bacterium]
MKNKVLITLTVLLLSAGAVLAQELNVSGTVLDANNDPVVGATVTVKGSTTGTVTGINGDYNIQTPPDGTLTFSFLGLGTVDVAVNGRGRLDVRMATGDQELQEVVVTAMGIKRNEKALGYSVTTVKGDDLAATRNSNALTSLAGRVAGLQVQSTSTDPGSASSVTIRGFGSINGSNQPLYVVDGVPLQSSSLFLSSINDNAVALTGLNNIAPDDIESTTVLKGAAATALYGSRASSGVILITTKKGQKGATRNFTVEYNGGMQFRQVSLLPTFQNEFGQGWDGNQTFIENGSWGPRFDGSTQVIGPIWNGQQLIHKYEALPNNVRDFFELGIGSNHNVSISGASNDNKLDYYLSYSNTSDDGIMPSDADSYKRNTIALRSGYQAAEWLKVSSNVSLANYKTDIVGSYQGASVIDGVYETARDVSFVDKKDLSSPFNTPEAYFTPYGITNPYWAIENNYNHTDGQQLFGKIQADFNPIKDLTFTYRYGFDYANYDTKIAQPVIDLDDALIDDDMGYPPSSMNQDGFVYSRYSRSYETNHDFLINYKHDFSKFSVNAFAGVNINERANTRILGQADVLAFNGFWDLANGSSWTTLTEYQDKRRLVGLFGDVTLGYDDMVYLDVTARNDWSSTLPLGENNYFYPGATLSWIFTRLIPENKILSFGKARLAYGQTGRDANVYLTNPRYLPAYADGWYGFDIAKFPMNNTNAFLASTTSGSPTLAPEMNTEFEVGLNLQFLGGRIGIDAAYYDRVTDNQIFSLPVDPATGFSTMVTNFGKVSNKGIELLLNTTPIKTNNFQWDLSVNFALNKNKVVSIPDAVEGGKVQIQRFTTAATYSSIYMYSEVGKPMGVYYAFLPKYTDDGKPIVNADGLPVAGDEVEYTGFDMNHKWTGGVTTSLTAYGVTLSAVLDVRYGGRMFSRSKNLMYFTGNGIATTYNDRNPFIIPNSVVDNGDGTYSENTTPLLIANGAYQEDYFDDAGAGKFGANNLIDKTFAKLRNITLSYALPQKWVKPTRLSGISLSAFVNNAFVWTASDNHYIDPEVSSYGTDLMGQFGELYANPSCRVWGFNVSLKF